VRERARAGVPTDPCATLRAMQLMRRLPVLLLLVLPALLLPAAAGHAATPAAVTSPAEAIEPDGARLVGTVDANGEPTSYVFEYGTTRRLGSRTPDASAGRGSSPRRVTTRVTGLTPNTTYFFRLVASNPSGVDGGAIRSFRTRPQPLGLQIGATPNPVTFNFASTITGQLTGTGNAGRSVQLQTRPFPYTTPFTNLGAPAVTDANGGFAFPLAAVPATAQYRVVTTDRSNVTSPILILGVAVRVKTNVSTTRPRRGSLVRFSGTIRPARPGALYAIQKQTSTGGWVTISGSITRTGGETFSGFSKRVRVRRGGNYRVFVSIVDGNLLSGIGRTVTLRTR
jgi:hypothetical protein